MLAIAVAGCGDDGAGEDTETDGGFTSSSTSSGGTTTTTTTMTTTTGPSTTMTAGPTTMTTTPPTTMDMNIPPEVFSEMCEVEQDPGTLDFAAPGLLMNDVDVEMQPLSVTDFDSTSRFGGAVDVGPDGAFTYTAAPGTWGVDGFTYEVSDGEDMELGSVEVKIGLRHGALAAFDGLVGGFRMDGEQGGDRAGVDVAGGGDINGDGLADIIVGADLRDTGEPDTGRVYVVFGRDDDMPIDLAAVAGGEGGFAIDGSSTDDRIGEVVAVAGDVDGDGLDDVLIGAKEIGDAGQAFVVFGKDDGDTVALADVAGGDGGFVMIGEVLGDRAGFSVAGAGDMNGDGRSEVIVGADSADFNGDASGRVYVVFGKDDGSPVQLADIANGVGGGFAMTGRAELDRTGNAVAGNGDINNDGIPDVVIGASGSDPNGESSAGVVYVVFGKATTDHVSGFDIAAGMGGFVLNGVAENDLTGSSVATGGDVNGDGFDDIAIGAIGVQAGAAFAGRVYVVAGKADGAPIALAGVANGGGGYVIDGEGADHAAGTRVAFAGDVNADGREDVVVAAPGADPNGPISGRVYYVFGKNDGTAVSLSDLSSGAAPTGIVFDGAAEGDFAGLTATPGGDVNGDGLVDFVMSARHNDGIGSDSGRAYVVYGVGPVPNAGLCANAQ